MAPKISKEQSSDVDTTRTEFITKLSTTAETMRQFGNFADALAKVVAKAPLDDPEVVEALQAAIDAIPTPSRKRKLTVLSGADEGKRRKREKKPKDPNAPKAPPSAYILFQNEIRNTVRDANPNIQYRDLMGLISQQWNSLSSDKKKPYFDRVSAAKQTHGEEMAKYNASHANHVPSEGTSKTAKNEAEVAAKPEKKVVSKAMKVAPKTAELLVAARKAAEVRAASSENEQSEAADDDDDDDESVGEEKEEAEDDVGSSEEESDEEPTPPPAKKAKKADKRK